MTNPVASTAQLKVLALALSDVRATVAQSQAVQAAQTDPAARAAQTADVILDLSAAARQLTDR
jgi:hypothetical protein